MITLEEDIDTIDNYKSYRLKVEGIIENYLNVEYDTARVKIETLFQYNEAELGDTIEELINGINNFNGGFVIITHDIYLIENINDARIFHINDNDVKYFGDDFNEYINFSLNNK